MVPGLQLSCIGRCSSFVSEGVRRRVARSQYRIPTYARAVSAVGNCVPEWSPLQTLRIATSRKKSTCGFGSTDLEDLDAPVNSAGPDPYRGRVRRGWWLLTRLVAVATRGGRQPARQMLHRAVGADDIDGGGGDGDGGGSTRSVLPNERVRRGRWR